MGRATRWFQGLFGIKKNKEQKGHAGSTGRKDKAQSTSSKESSGLCNNPATIPPNISAAEAAWLRSYYAEPDKGQNKHAIAVAAATAAAADAAVAAAQAAAAVVRLTSHGRGTMFGGGRERCAAVTIQTVFRGYLARKALRALKALVKLQALVRGYLVRKQATATLQSMQALIRAQASVRSQRARKSMEGYFDDTRSEHLSSIHSRRLSASLDNAFNTNGNGLIDEVPKIVEIDTGNVRPKSRSRSRANNTSMSDFCDDPFAQRLSSPLPCRISSRLSIPDGGRSFQDSDWGLTGDKCKFSTAQSTPRFMNSSGSYTCLPVTPAKSVCADNYFRQYGQFPNYMTNTQSFKAKLRSQSAPKQRPEPGSKKKLSLNEMMEPRSSLSGIKMQRSCSRAQEVISFKNAVMGKLDRSSDFVSESERGYYLHKRW